MVIKLKKSIIYKIQTEKKDLVYLKKSVSENGFAFENKHFFERNKKDFW